MKHIKLFEAFINEANIKHIDIQFTDRGSFYTAAIDGDKRAKDWDGWKTAEQSLSKLLGWTIYLRNIDEKNLDKAIKDLKRKGIKLTWNDIMDVS